MPRPISYAVFCLKKKKQHTVPARVLFVLFFFHDSPHSDIYTLSLHDALPISRVARLMIHTPTAISIFVCLSMVQLMAVFISMRCTLCGHFLQVALTLILVVGYAIAAS